MAMTPLPTPPSRGNDASTFSTRADALLAALPDFVTEANALEANVEGKEASATTAATNAATSETNAAASASAAAASEANAATSEANAANSANAAATSYDSFDDRYLGAKAADPTTDNDGAALLVGALYWNTAAGQMRAWDGAAWQAAYLPAGAYLTGADIGVNVQAYDADLDAWSVKGAPTGAVVGTSDTQTLTNKTLTGLKETRVAMAAADIDLSAGNFFSTTVAAPVTFTVSNVPATGTAASFILDLTNGGSAAVTWWAGVKWAGGTAPTLTASGRDVLGFYTHDGGTTWTGLVLGVDVK